MASYNTYLIDNELYVSVSTILNVENPGSFLIFWALRKFGGAEDSVKAYNAFMKEVSETGTEIHEVLEHDLLETGKAGEVLTERAAPAVAEWNKWKQEHEIKVIASEIQLHSKKYRVAGTCDLVAEIDGQLYIADFKTGSVQEKAFTQMAAYKQMLCEVPKKDRIPGIEKADLAVINVHRDGKPVEFITHRDYYKDQPMEPEDHLAIFHSLRYVWAKRNLKSKKFAPIIKDMSAIIDPLNKDFHKEMLTSFEPKRRTNNKRRKKTCQTKK